LAYNLSFGCDIKIDYVPAQAIAWILDLGSNLCTWAIKKKYSQLNVGGLLLDLFSSTIKQNRFPAFALCEHLVSFNLQQLLWSYLFTILYNTFWQD
jgi:hypothetical protein